MKLICDVMLGKLSRWLRILGFDVLYDNLYSDEKLIEITTKEERILLSRDRVLVNKLLKNQNSALYVKSTVISDQLLQIRKEMLHEKEYLIQEIRCTICNNLLITKNFVKKDKQDQNIVKRIPEKVLLNHDEFFYCSNCDKYFWRGIHWENIQKTISQINKK
ncbi:MAG: Mut7-C RNAse domain-containing protein [Candidatus Ranarchaeia archaeon]